jgi:hypothetical protein
MVDRGISYEAYFLHEICLTYDRAGWDIAGGIPPYAIGGKPDENCE